MSETIKAVIVGGAIASIFPILTLLFEISKWKSNHKIEILTQKRNRLESKYKEITDKLLDGMSKNFYGSELIADFMVAFPDKVKNAFNEMMRDKEKHTDNKKMKFHYMNIIRKMKESLVDIENKINKEIN